MIFSKALMEQVLKWQEDTTIKRRMLSTEQMENAIKYLQPKRYERLDNISVGISKKDMETLLKQMPKPRQIFVNETGDCDNYAKRFNGLIDYYIPGICVGIVTVTLRNYRHALNVFVSDKGTIYFIEPQTYKIYKPLDYRMLMELKSVDNILL